MTGLLVVIIPLLLMLFAFAMERIESSLLHTNMTPSPEVKLAKDADSADGSDEIAQQEANAA
ncbi:hypothetical protein [Corynebacterium deserti]|nr:hypothetical protein [Corynebacterium deserti]